MRDSNPEAEMTNEAAECGHLSPKDTQLSTGLLGARKGLSEVVGMEQSQVQNVV